MPDVREWPSQLRGNGQSLHESETVGQSETGSRRVVKCEPEERERKKRRERKKSKKTKSLFFHAVRQSLFLCTASAPMEFGEPVIPCNFVQLLEPPGTVSISPRFRDIRTDTEIEYRNRSRAFLLLGSFLCRAYYTRTEPSTDYGRLAESDEPQHRALNVIYVRGRDRETAVRISKDFWVYARYEEGADTIVAELREWGRETRSPGFGRTDPFASGWCRGHDSRFSSE